MHTHLLVIAYPSIVYLSGYHMIIALKLCSLEGCFMLKINHILIIALLIWRIFSILHFDNYIFCVLGLGRINEGSTRS